jgi:uncharacterized protein YcsI (UPF0317 family)
MKTQLLILVLLAGMFPTAILADKGDKGDFEFRGFVDSLPSSGLVGDWMVSGRTVHVSAATRIEQEKGPVVVGAFVEVKGFLRTDGSVDATKIEVEAAPGAAEEIKFEGIIQGLPPGGNLIGDWMISGRTVHVSAATRIEQEKGPVVVGAFVEVKGFLRTDGSVDATKIEVEAAPGAAVEIEFHGVIERLPSGGLIGDWIVSGRTVHVSSATRISPEKGPVVVGAPVEVKGFLRTDGSIDATKIEVAVGVGAREVRFEGIVQSLPSGGLIGDWIVSGRKIHVTAETRIKQKRIIIAVGVFVEVKGVLEADGSITANKIKATSP